MEWYEIYLETYLTGLDSSRIFADDGLLAPEARKSYERFMVNHQNTKPARILETYWGVLRKNGFRDTPEITGLLDEHKLQSMIGKEPPIR